MASQTQHGGRFWAELAFGPQAWQSSAFTSLQRESGPRAGGVLIGLQNARAPWGSGGFINVLINGLIVPMEVWAPALGKTLCFPPPNLA